MASHKNPTLTSIWIVEFNDDEIRDSFSAAYSTKAKALAYAKTSAEETAEDINGMDEGDDVQVELVTVGENDRWQVVEREIVRESWTVRKVPFDI